MKKFITIAVIIALVALIVLRLASNKEKLEAAKVVKTDLTYVTVNVANVQKMALRDSLKLIGYLDAFTEVDIAAEASGVITSLNANLGDVKQKGAVIATIDDKLKQLAVRKAKIDLDKLQKTLDRYKNLYKGGTLTEQQLDDAQTMYDNAVLQLEQAEKQLADATIKAPISGIVSRRLFEKGEFVNMGSPLVTMVDISRFKIKLNVSETNVYQLKTGDKALVTTDVYPGVKLDGKVSYISPKGDDTHNYAVEIEMANSREYPLKSGTFAYVQIELPVIAEALYIPRQSLLGSVNDAKVYVAENGKANLRTITVREGNDQYLQVISGLKENDQVVVNGQINLADGKEIKIIN
jgi:membrane fusion protein (multidrug efflux system)